MDGARLGSALTCDENDIELSDLARLTDIFYIGGTKNGALLGEALIIVKDSLKEDFRYLIKQRGALMAKGFVIGVQFEELFKDMLYYKLAKHANDMAKKIAEAIKVCGYSFYVRPSTNQLFPILPNTLLNKISKDFRYMTYLSLENDYSVVRFVTSWASSSESVDRLCEALSS